QNIPVGTVRRDKTFAFIIANENYTRVDPVTFALNDGEMMHKYCKKTLGIPAKNISFVADASLNDMRYQLKRMSDICSAFGGEASVIVYYAGHGVPEEGSSNAYLLPVDGYAENVNTGISLQEVVESLSELKASNVTLLLDACFSGTGREGKALYASRGVAMKPKAVAPKGNLVIFSASQGVESALPYKDKQHGLFTYFLLKKLKESRGQIILGDLVEYVTDNVKRTSVVEGKIQTPTVSASSDKADWREINL
ncbi:MAG: caspase family protein, partial [Muribaculaceae bacterium]|nr:caspase family protein [Muribaculaceae bacterium]